MATYAQELTIFTRADFDLKGPVKKAIVITDYGREHFEFDSIGRLATTVTQYNENDQDITRYWYKDSLLVEKRMESYKNGTLDPMTSMGNFFAYDTTTTQKKVVEKIVSYDKEFFEKLEYFYDENGALVRIMISSQEGVDEKRIEHSSYKNETTQTFFLNEVIEKSVRTSKTKNKNGAEITTVLTKEYVDGQPNTASEKKMFADGRVFSEHDFIYDEAAKEFVSKILRTYTYTADKVLDKEVIKRGNAESVRTYIFQFDNNEPKNWVKKIITPENEYITRKIEYFEIIEEVEGGSN